MWIWLVSEKVFLQHTEVWRQFGRIRLNGIISLPIHISKQQYTTMNMKKMIVNSHRGSYAQA